jgi:hypothetical protein
MYWLARVGASPNSRPANAGGPVRRGLRARCESLVDELDVRVDPFELEEFCRSVGRRRQRPIVLQPYPLGDCDVTGAWIATARVDYILYEANTPRPHQEHIVLHEVGHLLCDRQDTGGGHLLASELFATLDAAVVQRVLTRSYGYDDDEERSAEMFASVLLRRIAGRRRRRPGHHSAGQDGDRISRALGDEF